MCLEGNSAPLSIRYLNAQLTSLWENAVQCSKDSSTNAYDVKSQAYEKSKYTRALGQFQYFGNKAPKVVRSTEDLLFYATFGKPEVKFICNHEAVLFLTIKEGHANLDFGKATLPGGKVDRTKNKLVKNVQVAYRVEFSRSNIKGRDSKVGNTASTHFIQMLILNLEKGRLVTLKGEKDKTLPADTKDALGFYLRKYLDFLTRSGNHVLFDLPDFDDDKFKAKIDYATHKDTTMDLQALCHGVTVQEIDVQQVNDALYFRWQNAARRAERPADFLSLCLAQMSSAWLINSVVDHHFFIRFGVPKVQALCSREVILTFDIHNIAFFKTSDFESEGPEALYADWTISFIVGVVRDKGSKHITLDLNSARYASRFSSYKKVDTIVVKYFEDIVKFLTVDYLDILVQYSVHIVQIGLEVFLPGGPEPSSDSGNTTWSETDNEDDQPGRPHGEVVVWTQRIESMHLFGFDQILALSQVSINSLFFSLHKKAQRWTEGFDECLAHWSLDSFSADFDAISVRLLSNGKAVIFISINAGELAVRKETEKSNFWTWVGWSKPTSKESIEMFSFDHVTVAFEVDLEMKQHHELAVGDAWYETFNNTFIYKYRRVEEHVFKHLLLNFRNPKYLDELSNVAALGKGRDSPTRLDTLLHYLKDYLLDLSDGGHNIIYSIPVFTNRDDKTFGYTSVAHKIVTKSTVTIGNCGSLHEKDAPIILILGVCNFRPMPPLVVEWFPGWIIENKRSKSHGTLCLSKAAFLEGRLLPLLAEVNAVTTLIPKFAGVIDGDWHFDLTTWKDDIYRHAKLCNWKEKQNVSSQYLEYVWEHRDEWSHEHEGTYSDERNGEYSLSCRTKNKLHIPTVFRANSLEIQLTGESILKVGGKDDSGRWSKRTSAKWSASIFIYSRAGGLAVEVSGQIKPVFSEEESEGQCAIDVSGLHSKYLPYIVHLDEVLESLKSTLEGGWEFAAPGGECYALTNPVFTRKGDLVVQLCEYKAPSGFICSLPPRISYSQQVTTINTASKDIDHSEKIVKDMPKIGLPRAPFGFDRDFNASVSTLDSPPLKTPSPDFNQTSLNVDAKPAATTLEVNPEALI
ncbi:unnamed protein product [Somion occarium]